MEARSELGVPERDRSVVSGTKGAAMARLEVGLNVGCAHRSGEGVSPLSWDKDAGFEDAAERGRG